MSGQKRTSSTIGFSVLLYFALISLLSSKVAQAGEFGIYGGLNLARVSVDPEVPTEGVLGFLFGVRYEMGFWKAKKHLEFSVVPGLQFAERGYGGMPSGVAVDFYTNYVEAPVLFKILVPREPWFTPYFILGPNIGARVRTSCSMAGADCTVLDESNLAKTQFAIEGGGGFDFVLDAGGKASVELRYFYGLTDTVKTDTTLRNRGFQLVAAYSF